MGGDFPTSTSGSIRNQGTACSSPPASPCVANSKVRPLPRRLWVVPAGHCCLGSDGQSGILIACCCLVWFLGVRLTNHPVPTMMKHAARIQCSPGYHLPTYAGNLILTSSAAMVGYFSAHAASSFEKNQPE